MPVTTHPTIVSYPKRFKSLDHACLLSEAFYHHTITASTALPCAASLAVIYVQQQHTHRMAYIYFSTPKSISLKFSSP